MENVVLCGANSYIKKFYINPEFEKLPQLIKQELQILCVTFTEEIGGIFVLEFKEDGNLNIKVSSDKEDFNFDEIGSELKIKKIQEEKKELFNGIETYYKAITGRLKGE